MSDVRPVKVVINVQDPVKPIAAPTPCETLGHRWAWTVRGHQECYRCGKRR